MPHHKYKYNALYMRSLMREGPWVDLDALHERIIAGCLREATTTRYGGSSPKLLGSFEDRIRNFVAGDAPTLPPWSLVLHIITMEMGDMYGQRYGCDTRYSHALDCVKTYFTKSEFWSSKDEDS